MGEESKQEQKFPEVVVRALVKNLRGEFLLIDTVESKGKLVCPGGHLVWGKSLESCLKERVLEEVGLHIKNLHFVNFSEHIMSNDYLTNQHVVSMRFVAEPEFEKEEVKIDKEAIAYEWMKLEDILKSDKVHSGIKDAFQAYKEKSHKERKWFGKCADCERHAKEAQEFRAGWQRALADYRNLQKEIEIRKSDWLSMSEQEIVREFIPIYDNFKKAAEHSPDEFTEGELENNGMRKWQNWKIGIDYIKKQFGEVLKAHEVEEISTVGKLLDTKLHEAVGEEQTIEFESGHIIKEVDPGYTMKGRVIKPAKVIVAK